MNSNNFKELGFTYIENVLSKDECIVFAKHMVSLKNKNKLKYEGDEAGKPQSACGNAYGLGGIPEMEKLLTKIQPQIEEIVGNKVKPANSFARIYLNGARLIPHTDRAGLDYTMTITLYSNINEHWDFHLIDKQGNTNSIKIFQGDGALILGREIKHWRNSMFCKPDQFIVQLFLHWSKVDDAAEQAQN